MVLAMAAVVCVAVGAVTGAQAIAMALPAALLIVGGLIWAAAPDAATVRRVGFLAGFQFGSLLSRLRSAFFRQRGNGL
jgi:hypothetical protein